MDATASNLFMAENLIQTPSSDQSEDTLSEHSSVQHQPIHYIPAYKTSRGLHSEATISAYNVKPIITLNLLNFVRRVIDSTLDRQVTFCEQPRKIVHELERICAKAWPQVEPRRHRNRIRAYLKACRRNAKKNFGLINMKEPPLNSLTVDVRAMVRAALERTQKDVNELKRTVNSNAQCPLDKFLRDSAKLDHVKPPIKLTPNPPDLKLALLNLFHKSTQESAENFQTLLNRLIANGPLKVEDLECYAKNWKVSQEVVQYTKTYLQNLMHKVTVVEEHIGRARGSDSVQLPQSLLDYLKVIGASRRTFLERNN
ncbi:hypothetical protein Ciccas_009316 [Cichlidogyrus casuarinus]|uniref:Nucleolar protein 4 helical domain-containing protein n=1 Tax=Cichlidogyrus casuarinus TaxID=1844966 RepID=A0ABD2PXU4_9PLAT